MKIVYLANARIPTEKAHGYQIAKVCESLAALGAEVELWVPTRRNAIEGDLFSYYGLKNNFTVRRIWSPDMIGLAKILGPLAFYLQALLFFLRLIFVSPSQGAWVMTRSPELAWLFHLKGYQTAFYAHYWPEHGASFYRSLLCDCDVVICNSLGTADAFSRHGFSNTIVIHNGVDLADFEISETKNELRTELGLPAGKIAVYTGHLYAWKGTDVLLHAAERLSSEGITFVLVGGTETDVAARSEEIRRRHIANIILAGHKPKKLVPKYLLTADVLLLPNAPVSEESKRYTSPIKLFEYLASGVPIVASDLPSIREVLSEETAVLVTAGDARALAAGIERVLSDRHLAEQLSRADHELAARSTWQSRAEAILERLSR